MVESWAARLDGAEVPETPDETAQPEATAGGAGGGAPEPREYAAGELDFDGPAAGSADRAQEGGDDGDGLPDLAPPPPVQLGEFVGRVIRESGLEDAYRRAQDDERLENLAELVSSAVEFQAQAEAQAGGPELDEGSAPEALSLRTLLEGYLERAALVADSDAIDPTLGSVTLMTLHAAKGLEYPHVALIGLEEGVLPHMRAVQAPSDAPMEEERRLAFVGITRAMESLLITSSVFRTIRGVPERTMPSRFLEELQGPEIEFSDQAGYGAGRATDPDADAPHEDDLNQDPERPRQARGGGGGGGARPEFAPGRRVRHPQFGVGTVESFMGGPSARVRVNFRDVGVKTLVLEYARLTPL
jgi:DNA helicase-2/ATP-dependent DNA helicase PcrA